MGINLARLLVQIVVKTQSKSQFILANLQGHRWPLKLYTRRATGGRNTERIADWRQHRLAVEIETRLSTSGTSA